MRSGPKRSVAAGLVMLLTTACASTGPGSASRDTLKPLHGEIDPASLDAPNPVGNDIDAIAGEIDGSWVIGDVIDGGTIDVVDGAATLRVRLIGIDPPTGDECLAQLATDSVKFMVGGDRALKVTANTGASPGVPTPGYIETIDGNDIGAELLRLGLAVAVTDVDDSRLELYEELQAEAAEAEAGVWDQSLCDDGGG